MYFKMKNLTYRTYYRFGRFCFFALTLLLSSCVKDPAQQRDSDRLQFSIEQASDWGTPKIAAQTKSEDNNSTTNGPVILRGETSKDTLFLHSSIKENTGFRERLTDSTGATTRSTPIDNSSFYSSFGVFAYAFDTWSESVKGDFMYNLEVTKADNWQTKYYWPNDGRQMRFFAYAPYNCDGLTLPSAPLIGTPTVDYTVPDDVADQTDLLATWTADQTQPASSATVPLSFHHILAAVRFVTGDQILQGKITKVTLKDIPATGTYTPNTAGVGSWTDLKNNKTFTKTLSVTVDGSADQPITSPDATFMMIPQELPSSATIEIEYADDLSGITRTLSASIAGQNWPEGKTVTYRISTSSIDIVPTLTVTGPADFTYQGGSNNYTVTSYGTMKLPGDVEHKIPLAWTAEFYAYNEETGDFETTPLPSAPEWLTQFTTQGDGSTTAASFSATVAAQTAVESNPHNDILQQASPVVGTYDLSTKGGTTAMNTANCYVINAPGKYSLPLVYGNAIKNGSDNPSSYTSSASGSTILEHFVNHLDAAITSPYIYDNSGCNPDNAVLVWQDEQDLVTNVDLTSDKHTLTFEVPQENIRQGNAIVAVRDASNTILWSWHIWVTDFVPGLAPTIEMTYDPSQTPRDKVVTNFQNVQYTFMGVPIGWCAESMTLYSPRKIKVVITQTQSSESTAFIINQVVHTEHHVGNAPYYQWGRKDPMLPVIIDPSNSTDKPCYASSNYKFQVATGKVSIGKSISNPNLFYNYGSSTPEDWCSAHYMNLWSADNTTTVANDNDVIKTVYDPSPVGYHLPTTHVFTGVTYNGSSVSGNYFGSGYNSPYTSSADILTNLGWLFYCNKMQGAGQYDTQGGVIFFPALGARHLSTGQIYRGGEVAYSWTAIPYNTAHGYTSYFTATGITPYADSRRSYGIAICSVREQ